MLYRWRLVILAAGFALQSTLSAAAPELLPKVDEIYRGWLSMYDLQFDDAHIRFDTWKKSHPDDPLGPASDAAAYLFSELARLGALESELFVDDEKFIHRPTLSPDAQIKSRFLQQIDEADHLADLHLQQSDQDTTALFVKSLTYGLRANYAGLVEKRDLAALGYTKEGRPYAERLLAIDPDAGDSYLGSGVENYLLSLKAAPLRVLLRLTGSHTDRATGIAELWKTSARGYYLEPFAKLLLAVAALRDHDSAGATALLHELHERFPHNELYTREIARIAINDSTEK